MSKKHRMDAMNIFKFTATITLSLVSFAVAGEPAKQTDKPIKILQIVGQKHHDYESQKVLIQQGVSERVNGTWKTHHHHNSTVQNPIYLDMVANGVSGRQGRMSRNK